jgi:hypothetical protein
MFPSDDPITVPRLRLAAATNDARYLQSLAIEANQELELASGTQFDRKIRHGNCSTSFAC